MLWIGIDHGHECPIFKPLPSNQLLRLTLKLSHYFALSGNGNHFWAIGGFGPTAGSQGNETQKPRQMREKPAQLAGQIPEQSLPVHNPIGAAFPGRRQIPSAVWILSGKL